MIKIKQKALDLGLYLLEITETCPNSHNCLWIGRRKLIPMLNNLRKFCPAEKCGVIIFREAFEDNSPAFYAEALKFCQFDGIDATIAARDRRIHDLRIFGRLVVFIIYPLFSETGVIPFLKPAEIEELRNNYYEVERLQTIKRMNEISHEWLEWVQAIMKNILSPYIYERYSSVIIYLVYLFLKGMGKNQLPDLMNMSWSEKHKFFSEIEKMISKK